MGKFACEQKRGPYSGLKREPVLSFESLFHRIHRIPFCFPVPWKPLRSIPVTGRLNPQQLLDIASPRSTITSASRTPQTILRYFLWITTYFIVLYKWIHGKANYNGTRMVLIGVPHSLLVGIRPIQPRQRKILAKMII